MRVDSCGVSPCGDGFEFITVTPPDGFCWAVVFLWNVFLKQNRTAAKNRRSILNSLLFFVVV
ncbi:MAG: hypothetical protein FWH05_08385 [Oscillospiraceae bacterium]|nr:hypothetical protein [Oscillospiraceae bacterium]